MNMKQKWNNIISANGYNETLLILM